MNSRFVLIVLITFFSTLANASSTSFSATTWRLPGGYYTPAKMPMTVVFPRPDSETNTWARQRIAYADGVMQYRIPVSIQGGAYPFHYQLVSGPSGMTIGQYYGDSNYGIVTWTPTAQGGPYNVDVKVSDQDGNSVDVTWSVIADNSKFIFIDPNATTNGTGTKASPLNTMQGIGVTPNSGQTSPYAGKAIIIRAGTVSIADTDTHGNYIMSPDTQNPAVFLGYTGENAQIDMSSGMFRDDDVPDVYFGQLKLINATNRSLGGERDTVMFFTKSPADRITFFENTFYNLPWYSGAGSSSNQAAIVTWNPGSYRHYFTVIGNTIDNFSVALVNLYSTKYGVIDNNKLLSGAASSYGGIFLKSDINSFSVRGNQSLTHHYGYGAIGVYMQNLSSSMGNDKIEICYNTLLDTSSNQTSGERELVYGVEGGSGTQSTRVYVYRNTVLGGVRGYDFKPYSAWLENNVFISAYGSKAWDITSGTYKVVYASNITQSSPTGNLYGTPSDGFIDQNGALLGATVSQYRGKVGAEITGNNITPLSAPSWSP